MSALGQKQTHAVQQRMSASPPIATAKAESACRLGDVLKPVLAWTASARMAATCAAGREGAFPKVPYRLRSAFDIIDAYSSIRAHAFECSD